MEPVFADRKSVLDYAERTFGTLPDYPWLKDPKSAVLRHQDTAKSVSYTHLSIRIRSFSTASAI